MNFKSEKTKKQIIDEIKETASKAEKIYLATDPDREGEAIA
jgi:DNA topoisomerase IA